jgi:RNA polymerase sigma-70 factor (ECF subfamily)
LEECQPDDARPADGPILAREEAEKFYVALDQLSPAHRDVLILRYLEGMEYEEIARVVCCEIGTVRSRLHYAKQTLRTVLERTDDHDR